MVAEELEVLQEQYFARAPNQPGCSQLLARRGAAAAALPLPRVPLLQVLRGQRCVQRSTQRQHALVQREPRSVQAVHCGEAAGRDGEGLGVAGMGSNICKPRSHGASLARPAWLRCRIQCSHLSSSRRQQQHPPAPTLSLRVPRNRKQAGTARPMKAKSSPAIVPSVSPTWLASGTSLQGAVLECSATGKMVGHGF